MYGASLFRHRVVMNVLRKRVFALLKGALKDVLPESELFRGLSEREWAEVFAVLSMHGVAVFVFDAVGKMPAECRPSPSVLHRFISQSLRLEKEYELIEKLSGKMSSLLADNGIKGVMLKGHTIAVYYMKPFVRKSVDVDIYSPDGGEAIDALFRSKGVTVDSDFYRHSHFYLNRVMVENHKCLLDIRGRNTLKAHDEELKMMVKNYLDPFPPGLHRPDPLFAGIFNLHHALSHFIYEGISFKFLTDWALFLKGERDVMASYEMKDHLERHSLLKFAAAMTVVAVRYMGLSADYVPSYLAPEMEGLSPEVMDKFVDDLFRPYEPSHSHNIIKERTVNVRRIIKASWKPREFLGQSAFLFVINKFIPILLGKKYEAD